MNTSKTTVVFFIFSFRFAFTSLTKPMSSVVFCFFLEPNGHFVGALVPEDCLGLAWGDVHETARGPEVVSGGCRMGWMRGLVDPLHQRPGCRSPFGGGKIMENWPACCIHFVF